uniref:Uncharacterized protein n=1 Tax=viral metagenome TaxID=1070528 RepID=A0A6C0EAF9_9ZZZZ
MSDGEPVTGSKPETDAGQPETDAGQQEQINADNIIADTNPKVSTMNYGTIRAGTKLYHASSEEEKLDPITIKVEDKDYVLYFTPNLKIALEQIGTCQSTDEDRNKKFIHSFTVTVQITNILILSRTDPNLYNKQFINNKLNNLTESGTTINAIGFILSEAQPNIVQYAIHAPRRFMTYHETMKCSDGDIVNQNIKEVNSPYVNNLNDDYTDTNDKSKEES